MVGPIDIRAPFLFAAGAIWPPICTIVVVCRFMTRRAQKVGFGMDDWLVLPALALIYGIGAAILAGTALKGVGYPTPSAPGMELYATSPQQTVTRKLYWIITLMQTTALCCIKVSCMLFYRRIFRTGVGKRFEIFSISFIVLLIAWFISFLFAYTFLCRTHFSDLWESIASEQKCTNILAVDNGLALSDCIMDLIVLVFPMPLIWRLQMTLIHKLLLTLIFILGALAIAASIGRAIVFIQAVNVEYSKTSDKDFSSTAVIYFMIIEAGFALCAISLPTLAGAFKLKGVKRFMGNIQSSLSVTRFRSSSTTKTPTKVDTERGWLELKGKELYGNKSTTTTTNNNNNNSKEGHGFGESQESSSSNLGSKITTLAKEESQESDRQMEAITSVV